MDLITRAQLARVASRALPHVANAIADHAGDVLPRYGIVTPLRIAHFLAQILVETGYLRAIEEDMSYSAAQLRAVWPRRFPTTAAAEPFAHRPEKLAELVYGGRMGNTPGDAYANRGQGLLQTTGHDNIAALAAHLNVTVDQARAMLTSDAWMLECAAATFVALGCLPLADRDDVAAVSRAVNGGSVGLADRKAALALCRKVWTPRAVIAPGVLIPKPLPFTDSTMTNTVDTAALGAALEKILTSPQTAELAQRAIAVATKDVSNAPAGGFLAGKKTYIVAALGAASTAITVGVAMYQNGGLTWAGVLAAIMAFTTCGGLGAMRAALSSHYGDLAGTLLDIGQSILLEVVQSRVPQPAEVGSPAMNHADGPRG